MSRAESAPPFSPGESIPKRFSFCCRASNPLLPSDSRHHKTAQASSHWREANFIVVEVKGYVAPANTGSYIAFATTDRALKTGHAGNPEGKNHDFKILDPESHRPGQGQRPR